MIRFFKDAFSAASLMVVLAGLPGLAAAANESTADDSLCGDPAVEAPKVADKYFDAFNAGDLAANASALHFPSYMISPQGDFYTFDNLESYVEMLQGFKAYWHHEHVVGKKVFQTTPKKAHIAISAARYDEKNVLLNVHESLWIVTCKDGRWGIKARSHLEPVPPGMKKS